VWDERETTRPVPWQPSSPFSNPLLFVIPSKARNLRCAIRGPRSYPPTTSTKSSTDPHGNTNLSFVIPEDDTAITRSVAVINEAFARRFFKNDNVKSEATSQPP
jgi:hypothetical protein